MRMNEFSILRVAAIGVGSLGPPPRPKLRRTCTRRPGRFVGVCDTNAETATQLAAEHGSVASFTDWRELLDKVDAVSIATPTETHCEIACAFFEKGIHVLVEKPIAIDVRRGRQNDRGRRARQERN